MTLVPASIRSQPPAPPLRFWPYFLPALAAAAIVFSVFPAIDLQVSALFFDQAHRIWPQAGPTSTEWARNVLNGVAWGIFAGAVAVSLATIVLPLIRRKGQPAWSAGIHAIVFICLCYAIGPGLLTNAGLKNHWGRARPNTVVEFGGKRLFTPALVPASQCPSNCSFVSGEGTLGFISASPSILLDGNARWAMLGAGAFVGVALGAVRVMQGAHFLSDVVFSALVAWFAAWLSYGLVYRRWLQELWRRRRVLTPGISKAG